MEVNDYLPTRTRVLSSETEGKTEPDIVTDALELYLNYTSKDIELIYKLKNENKLDILFQFLFIKQSNKLNEILPELFEKTNDWMEILLDISFVSEAGVIRQLIDTISEAYFKNQVEIIGWLYQFYNSELKDETFSDLKKGKKITKDKIPGYYTAGDTKHRCNNTSIRKNPAKLITAPNKKNYSKNNRNN